MQVRFICKWVRFLLSSRYSDLSEDGLDEDIVMQVQFTFVCVNMLSPDR